jgi:hypothetical protein
MPECIHLDQIRDVHPLTQGCEECLKMGDHMRSLEPGEDWGWCFIDQVELDFA